VNVQENFGKVVRIIREAKGWTIENLAEAANLHYTYLSDVERGRRNVSLKTIMAIATGLEVHPSLLFPGGDQKFREVITLLGLLNQDQLELAVDILKVLIEREAKKRDE